MRNRPAVDASPEAVAAIDAVLDRFGTGALRVAASAGVRFVHLRGNERYRDRSRALRRLASGVDDWPVPPAGLFVVEERAVYLRSTSPMTVAHEFAHALDCALGGGVYLSGVDPRVRRAFRSARAFITPYAALRPGRIFRRYVELPGRQGTAPEAEGYTNKGMPSSFALWSRVSRPRSALPFLSREGLKYSTPSSSEKSIRSRTPARVCP